MTPRPPIILARTCPVAPRMVDVLNRSSTPSHLCTFDPPVRCDGPFAACPLVRDPCPAQAAGKGRWLALRRRRMMMSTLNTRNGSPSRQAPKTRRRPRAMARDRPWSRRGAKRHRHKDGYSASPLVTCTWRAFLDCRRNVCPGPLSAARKDTDNNEGWALE